MQQAAYMQHMEQRYHLVANHQAARAEQLVVQQVEMGGHVLIVGGAASPGGLLAAISPFRSRALQRWVPEVILDDGMPEGGAIRAVVLALPVWLRALTSTITPHASVCMRCEPAVMTSQLHTAGPLCST
jgi:hypothetical protein